MKKVCLICKKEFEYESNEQNRLYCHDCAPKNDKNNNKMKSNKKKLYVDLMGGECSVCGYKKSFRAIDFHHMNPLEKDFSFGSTSSTMKKELLELQKCAILCSNCHREIHSGLDIAIPKQDYSKVKEHYDFIVNLDSKTCPICGGTKKTKYSKTCEECASVLLRKVERPSKETLEKEIKIFSFVELGKKYGVIDNTIRKWCKYYNLPYRKKDMR